MVTSTVDSVDVEMRAVLDALRYLDAACDGAVAKDGQGFNKPDSGRGKQLANRPYLTQDETREAFALLRKYVGQLTLGGISLPAEEKVVAQARQAEEGSGTIRLRQGRLVVAFPYSAAFVARAKSVKDAQGRPCAHYDGDPDRTWTVPLAVGQSLLETFPAFKISAEDKAAISSFQPSPYRGRIDLTKTQMVVSFEYDPDLVTAVKSVKDSQGRSYARFDGDKKVWRVPLEHYVALVKALPNFEIAAEVRAEVKKHQDAAAALVKREKDLIAQVSNKVADALDAPLPSGRTLFDHQKTGVKFLLDKRRVILADVPGLGKTATTLVAARTFGLPIHVICPKSLQINWQREAEMVGLTLAGVYSSAKIPDPVDVDFVLIADEAHQFQSLKSKRTQAMLDWALSPHCMAIYEATGTPIANGRPVNLYPLLKAVRHPLAADQGEYEAYYCNGHATRFTKWDVSGAAHLDELHKNTRDVMLRRTKEECLDLPAKTVVQRGVDVSAKMEKIYNARFAELRAEYKARVKDRYEALSKEEKERTSLEDMLSQAEALVMLGHVQHAASLAKIETATEMAEEVVGSDGQVVLFVNYKESGSALAERLHTRLFSGELNNVERQRLVDRFQAGQDKVFVCTIGAGGVGITLTAAQTGILVDRPWTPGAADQAADRLHRIGQRNAVTIYWLQFGEADKEIDKLLEEKQERIDLVLQGKRKTMRGMTDPGAIAQTLLPDILG